MNDFIINNTKSPPRKIKKLVVFTTTPNAYITKKKTLSMKELENRLKSSGIHSLKACASSSGKFPLLNIPLPSSNPAIAPAPSRGVIEQYHLK